LRILVGAEPGVVRQRRRHQRRGVRARGEGCATGGKSNSEFQKVAAFHHIFSSVCCVLERRVSMHLDERALNFAFRFLASGTIAAAAAFLHHAQL
jgi:hypothetical protein